VRSGRHATEGTGRRRLRALRPIMSSTIPVSKGLSPVIVRGLEDFARRLDEGAEVWDEPRWGADEFVDADDAVIVPGRFHGRGHGSGVETVARAVEVFWLVDGKVVRLRLCQDRAQTLEAAGLPPSKQAH